MANLSLLRNFSGVALAPHDRIRIVADTVLCGLAGKASMRNRWFSSKLSLDSFVQAYLSWESCKTSNSGS